MSVELNAGSLQGILSTSETVQAMLAQGPVIINDWVITTEAIEGGYRLTFRRGSEVQTMDILDGAVGPEGPQGKTGETGQRGSTWFRGNSVSGTDTVDWESGFIEENEVQVGDYYLNTDTFNVYVWAFSYDMTTGETAETWHYLGSIMGRQGIPGADGSDGLDGSDGADGEPGNKWHTGTAITGTSTTPGHFSELPLSNQYHTGDMYLNTSTSRVYQCTAGGSGLSSFWVYLCSIAGRTGQPGADGKDGADGQRGEKGLYYIPSMTADGRLEFTASEPIGEELDKITFLKPLYGADGADGAPGVGVSEITIAEVIADGR